MARAAAVKIGDCQLAKDPESDLGEAELGLNLCLKGDAGGEAEFASGSPKENAWIDYAHGYGALYLGSWFSVSGRGVYRRETGFSALGPSRRDVYTDFAVVQLGNPVLNKWRLTTGLVRLPVGIDLSYAPEFFRLRENRSLWASPPYGTYLTYDDLRAIRIDLGYATNEVQGKRVASYPEAEPATPGGLVPLTHAGSIRASYDLSALEGTRLVVSGYMDKNGERRYGAGIINVNSRDDMTEFEFLRRLTSPDGRASAFEQILRLMYAAAWHGDQRWVVEVDDERFKFRRGLLDHDSLIRGHVLFRAGIGYYKSESGDDVRRWTFITGLGVKL